MFKRKKKENNKGFTLVELIVVIVILAILAAILVPALLGYIDRAKGQQIVLNAKSCYTATQAEMSSMYGKSQDISKITDTAHAESILNTADVPCDSLVVGVKDSDGSIGVANKPDKHEDYTVVYIAYTENGQSIYFDGAAWVETDPKDGIENLKTFTIK